MITVLHRGGYAQMITILHRGEGGSLGSPQSDYVICARPLRVINIVALLLISINIVTITWVTSGARQHGSS